MIWERFPKFVFGFLVASLVFSWLISDTTVADTRGPLTAIRTTLFAMAFVSIGLETSLGSLVTTDGGRPAIAFLGSSGVQHRRDVRRGLRLLRRLPVRAVAYVCGELLRPQRVDHVHARRARSRHE